MTKPTVTLRNTKGSALDYTELDTNFEHLRDATFGVTDGTNSHDFDLNSRITFTAGSNITLAVDPSTGAITISGSGTGTVNSGTSGMLGYYPSTGTTIDDTRLKYSYDSGAGVMTFDSTTVSSLDGVKFKADTFNIETPVGNSALRVTNGGIITDGSAACKGYVVNTTSPTWPSLETRGNVASYANNATVDFANFSGMIMANRQDSSGNVSLWIVGSTGVVNIANSTGTANTGTIAYNSGINGYRWTNDTGGTITVSFATIKTRDGA